MYRRLFSLVPAFVAATFIGSAQADDSNTIDYSVEGSIRTADNPDFATAFGRSLDYFGECDFNDNFSLMLMENNEAFLMGSVSIPSFPYEAVLRPSEVYDRYVGGTLHLDLIFKPHQMHSSMLHVIRKLIFRSKSLKARDMCISMFQNKI